MLPVGWERMSASLERMHGRMASVTGAIAPTGSFSSVVMSLVPVEHLSSVSGGNLAVAAASPSAWVSELPEEGRPWAGAIESAAREEGVDRRLLASVVWAESGFRPEARSPAGAIGLAQLMPGTAAALGVDALQPYENLRGGARYLASMIRRFGSVELGLAAYNAGPGRVESAGGIPDLPETRAYVSRVLSHYTRMRGTG